jgi:hypothetical protein
VKRHGFQANAKLTHGSLEAADGSKTGQGEGAEAAQAASVTEPVKLWPHFYKNPRGEPLGAASCSVKSYRGFHMWFRA